MQVCQAHNESVFVWKSIVVSGASEHGTASFRAGNLRLRSSNEHVVAQHFVELSLVKKLLITFKVLSSVSFGKRSKQLLIGNP